MRSLDIIYRIFLKILISCENYTGRHKYFDAVNIVGDFNAKVGREGIFGPTVGQHSLYEKTSANGFRLVSFAAAHNMVISSTRFQHLNIHKATWRSPDLNTKNQIDHVVIDGRHA